jgi:hypothetical protein
MIYLCPFCGHMLPRPLVDGTCNCLNCNRVFDSTPTNILLSGGWMVRKQNMVDEQALGRYNYKESQAAVLIKFVAEMGMSHEQLVIALEELGVSKDFS